MKKKLLTYFLPLFTVFFLFMLNSIQAINLCSWEGYANISGTLVNTTDYIKIYNGTKTYDATIFSNGFYIADVQVDSTDVTISFKICGEDADQGGQAWSCPASDFNTLNLSITALSSGDPCTYSCACSGNGHCCNGATEYTDGSGSGTCQSSACSAAATTTTPSGGGGGPTGGAAAVTTTILTTTTPVTIPEVTTTPSVTTEPKVTTIPTRVTTIPRVPLGFELSTMQILGIIVGVVVILFLVVFLFVRFQAVKMAT